MRKERIALGLDRDLEDIKAQVKHEIRTIKEFCDCFSYRNSPQGWTIPFQLHRLRRAMRIHYLALKIRESTPVSPSMRELSWTLENTESL